jgi:hypothetical protein
MKSTLVVIALTLSPAVLLRAQDTTTRHSIAKDWISHHVIFSNPGTREQAIQNGTYDRWLRIVNDPRYIMQQAERSMMATAPSSTASDPATEDGPGDDSQPASAYNGPLPHGLAKAAIAPSPLAVPETKLPSHGRLKKDWSEGLTATNGTAGAAGATTGLGEFPATYEATLGTPSCTNDFAIYNTGLAGSISQASIIAYNNLYTTGTPICSPSPQVYWAFNTGGTIVNSIAFYAQALQNQTGTQLYFVQTVSGVANLVLLQWSAGSGTAINTPAAPNAVSAATYYSGCTLPCMTSAPLTGNPADTYSAPYYDPSTDTIYVGDDGGKLHKFNPVFNGALAEVIGGGWPASVNPNASLGSPVYYPGTPSAVFVGDYPYNYVSNCQPNVTTSTTPCGFLYSVSSSGTVTASHQLDYNNGIIDSPILDATAGMVYAFVGQDNSTSCALPPLSTGAPCAAVYQFPVTFTGGATGTEAQVGAGSQFMMSGAFDNAYFTSSNPALPTGHLYVVGGTGALNNTLYQVSK